MADVNARDAKLIQWLNEAYGKEKQLETALALHIQMAEGDAQEAAPAAPEGDQEPRS